MSLEDFPWNTPWTIDQEQTKNSTDKWNMQRVEPQKQVDTWANSYNHRIYLKCQISVPWETYIPDYHCWTSNA